ncbi:MAG: CPBP family intramembrane metalloprotease [bacterium]|nr:CPBP family intramembrane metalloprotease [bacterium]
MKSKIGAIAIALLAVVSLFVYINFRQHAFPEHSIEFKLDQEQAQQKALTLATDYLENPTAYKKATIFEIDETPKNYLEREIGAKQTGELAKADANLWYFTTRLFKTLQKEEFYASFAPDGRIVSFTHNIDETKPGTKLDKVPAQAIATQFLESKCIICAKTNFPQEWTLVQHTKTEKQNRVDHVFVYERKNFSLKDARQRVSVGVGGEKIISFNEYLKVPEQWISSFNKEKSYNNIAQVVAQAFSTLFIMLPLVIIFFKKYREKKLALKVPYITAIIISAITVFESVNSFTSYYFGYPTTQASATIAILLIFGLIVTWLVTYITTEATLATAESLFREVFPSRKNTTSLIKKALVTPFSTKGIFIGSCVGISFFLYELGYYFLGRSLGFWVPADINYSDAFNSVAPWMYPLTIGLLPAVSEEVTYRLFGISLFTKVFGKWIKNSKAAIILAIITSSVSWAFLHSAYPQMPFFVRGVELTIIGIAFSWLFLRFGILSSIAAHYMFNAMQMAIFFLGSKDLIVGSSSFIVALLPFWIVAISVALQKIKARKITDDQIPTNLESETMIEEQKPQVEMIKTPIVRAPIAQPIASKMKILLVVVSICSLALLQEGSSANQTQEVSKNSIIHRSQAISKAKDFLTRSNIDYSSFTAVATIDFNQTDDTIINYLQAHATPGAVNYFTTKNSEPEMVWYIRFFKPEQKEEYAVTLHLDGKVYTHNHIIEEKAAGARLSQAEAEDLATTYLSQKSRDGSSFDVLNTENLKRDNRDDYRFTFEDKEKIADATRRIVIDVVDGRPQNLQSYIKIPDNSLRESEAITSKQLLYMIGGTILSLIVLGLLSNTFFMLYREKKLTKKFGIRIAIIAILFSIISQLNNGTIFFATYDTDLPYWVFIVFQLVEILVTLVLTFIVAMLCTNAGVSLYNQYIGQIVPESPLEQKKLLGSALFLVLTLSTIGVCLLYASQHLSLFVFPPPSESINDTSAILTNAAEIQTYIPVLEGFNSVTQSIIAFFALITLLCTLRIFAQSWRNVLFLIGAFGLIIFFITDWKTHELLSTFVTIAPVIIYTALAWKYIVKNNVFFYILTTYYILIGLTTISFLNLSDSYLQLNGVLYALFAVLPFIFWLLYEKIIRKSPDGPASMQ